MSSENKLYLVTGGSGFLGSNLVKALVDRGERVRVFDNNFRGSLAKLGDYIGKVEFVEGDVRDKAAVLRAMPGVGVLCHLAYINGTKYFYEMPKEVLDVGVKGTINMLEAALESGVPDFVYASSSEVYQTPPVCPTPETVPMCIPDPLNPRYSYGGGKLIGEILSFNYGRGRFRRTVVFRPHNVYGPDMGFEHVIPEFVTRLKKASMERPTGVLRFPIQGDGHETRAFCEVRDFTAGLLKVVDAGADQNVYHIGNDEEISIRELALLIAKKMGREIEFERTPLRAGGTPRRCPDIAKLRALGYEPKIELAEGLDASIEWYSAWVERGDRR
jgi:dTDP-glucose 4,6-dehydratase/UDP-glucose 4-epimerase